MTRPGPREVAYVEPVRRLPTFEVEPDEPPELPPGRAWYVFDPRHREFLSPRPGRWVSHVGAARYFLQRYSADRVANTHGGVVVEGSR